jgi:TRAP-type C4-dicarboxylate transport system permease small subunit
VSAVPAGLRRLAANGVEILAGLLLAVLCLDVLVGVASRAFGRPVSWSEEVARYLYIWVTFVGAAVAVKRGANFSLNLLVSRLGRRWRTGLMVLGDLVTAAFGGALLVYGRPLVELAGLQRGAAVNIPLSWVSAAMPVGGALMAIYALVHLWGHRGGAPRQELPLMAEAHATRMADESALAN